MAKAPLAHGTLAPTHGVVLAYKAKKPLAARATLKAARTQRPIAAAR
jgi:hypothetical protein